MALFNLNYCWDCARFERCRRTRRRGRSCLMGMPLKKQRSCTLVESLWKLPKVTEFKKCSGLTIFLGNLMAQLLTHPGLKVFSLCQWLPFWSTGYQNNLKVLYSQVTPSSVKKTRYISPIPDRILDAPELRNDFCKLMFWPLFARTWLIVILSISN